MDIKIEKGSDAMGLGLIGAIIVGGLAGWFASMYMKANTGLLGNISLGILGAVVLAWLGIYAERSWLPQLVVGFVGASALIAIYRKVKA